MAENAARINYKYGEMAAENAFERQQVLYNRTYQDQSYANKVAQMDAAGLSPGLMYGGGGASGGGAGSTTGAPMGQRVLPVQDQQPILMHNYKH